MTKPSDDHEQLLRDLHILKLTRIAEIYREVLDDASRKNNSILEILKTLVADEVVARSERALKRRISQARLPKKKTLQEYDFDFPKRLSKQRILRLFDCQFIEEHFCGVFIGPTGVGKTHFLTALGYVACERGITVRFTRVVDMINVLTTAHVRRYRLRIDGFVSVHSPYDGGSLVTKPLTFTGNRLTLNYATSAAGGLRVELQTPDGAPIEGFSLGDCPEIIGDRINHVVSWDKGPDIGALASKPVRLRFEMKDADLYSLQFREV